MDRGALKYYTAEGKQFRYVRVLQPRAVECSVPVIDQATGEVVLTDDIDE